MNKTLLFGGGCLSFCTLLFLVVGCSIPWFVWRQFSSEATSCEYRVMQHWFKWTVNCKDCASVPVPFSTDFEPCTDKWSYDWRMTADTPKSNVEQLYNISFSFTMISILFSLATMILVCLRGFSDSTKAIKVVNVVFAAMTIGATMIAFLSFLGVSGAYDKDDWCLLTFPPEDGSPCGSFFGSSQDQLSGGTVKWMPGPGWIIVVCSLPFAIGSLLIASLQS
eukprot:TRINITY_DN3121_c0_g2_i1.p1 TRINITY_DN3121_c0_g2~~TRINITY_DN3121_c0_g2_i1.p1  ORF type:complete len:247 (-),score=67.46 TRINITY_DN3121_c0_g2_i1:101-766(-)